MIIKEIATISFCDGESGTEAVAIIRLCGDRMALAISIQDDGDLEILIDEDTAQKLVAALSVGIDHIKANGT